MDELTLMDWKRRVFALYADVRANRDDYAAWHHWRDTRDQLFREHPQSPLPPSERAAFKSLPYFDYDPALRVLAAVEPADGERRAIAASGNETVLFRRFAHGGFTLGGRPQRLSLFWLEGYGGGIFLPFADTTSGDETYGGGRYLLDTVKGADLGAEGDELVLDFNFAYNPSCAYDPRWVCPLTPPENRLELAVRGGELH
jgi:uncharacterized protein